MNAEMHFLSLVGRLSNETRPWTPTHIAEALGMFGDWRFQEDEHTFDRRSWLRSNPVGFVGLPFLYRVLLICRSASAPASGCWVFPHGRKKLSGDRLVELLLLGESSEIVRLDLAREDEIARSQRQVRVPVHSGSALMFLDSSQRSNVRWLFSGILMLR
jgi:hypothetical protein